MENQGYLRFFELYVFLVGRLLLVLRRRLVLGDETVVDSLLLAFELASQCPTGCVLGVWFILLLHTYLLVFHSVAVLELIMSLLVLASLPLPQQG